MVSSALRVVPWAPDPAMFTLGQRPITWYALLFVAGLLGGYALVLVAFVRERVDVTYANILLFMVGIGAVIGARLGQVFLYEWPYYRAHPGDIVKIWHGGLASHGAVIGIAIALWLYARFVIGQPFLWILDRSVAGIALAAACVRFGNLMNSEIVGKPTSVAWGFVFQRVDAVPRHPVQLYEGIAYLALCFVLLLLSTRYALPQGGLSGLFLVGMFAPRWLLEFTKEGPVLGAGMNTGQVLSLPLIAIGAAMLVVCWGRSTDPPVPQPLTVNLGTPPKAPRDDRGRPRASRTTRRSR